MVLKKLVRGIVSLLIAGVVIGGLIWAALLQGRTGEPVIGYVLLLPALFMFVAGLVFLIQGRRVRATEPDAAADAAAGGRVSLEGEAVAAGETLTAPVSGESCLAYRYEYDQLEVTSGGESGPNRTWRTNRTEVATRNFLLEDETGSVFVAVEDDAVSLELADDESSFTASDGFPERVERLADREGIEFGGSDQRFTECRLVPGETTYVAGEATPRTDAARQLPASASAVVGPASGLFAGLKRSLPGGGFTVSDAPIEATGERLQSRGYRNVFGAILWSVVVWFFTLRGQLPF